MYHNPLTDRFLVKHIAIGIVAACGLAACAAEFDLAGTWALTQADKPSVTCPVAVPGPDPAIKPMSLMSPALAGRFFTTSAI